MLLEEYESEPTCNVEQPESENDQCGHACQEWLEPE